MPPEPSDRHPDDIDLDCVRTGEASVDVAEHAADCAACQERIAALRKLAGGLAVSPASIAVPGPREAAIMADGARAAARARRRRRWRLAALPAAAAAAALLTVVLLRDTSPSTSSPTDAPRVAAPVADVNNDRAVDILDAFALARCIESGAPAQPAWDFNHDQVIDALDVDLLAQLAVSLTSKLQGGQL